MSRQKSVNLNETVVGKLHLQKQTLKIKNVGLKHQLSLVKSQLQSLIIKCRELSRVKENLYCLLEKTKAEKSTPLSIASQNQRESLLREQIGRVKEDVRKKGEGVKGLVEEHERYVKESREMVGNLSVVSKKILGLEEELREEGMELKEIKQINFDLEKMKRVLQEEKETTIAFQIGSKVDHQEFSKKYVEIIQRLMNDQARISSTLEVSEKTSAVLILTSLFQTKQLSYFRQFFRVRGYLTSGQTSLKCLDNTNKIVQRIWRQNTRRLFSCWFGNVFHSRRVGSVTENVIGLNCEQRTKFRIFSKMEEGYHVEQLRVLREYDRVKLVVQLRLKSMRKDAHIAMTKWFNEVQEWKQRVAGLKRVGKIVNRISKSIGVERWRHALSQSRTSEQTTHHLSQIKRIKDLSSAMNEMSQLQFTEQQNTMRLYFKRHQLLTKIRSQHNYMSRINRVFSILHLQQQKNELRSGFYIYRAKCLKMKVLETEEQFQVVRREGEVAHRRFKATLSSKAELRKNLLVSFLGRFLASRELGYERKIGALITRWQRRLVSVNATTKGAMRKIKLGVFSQLINHGARKKYRISPEQIELLKSKNIELQGKQERQREEIEELQKQHQRISLLRIPQIMESKLHLHKMQLFRVFSTMYSNSVKNRNLVTLLETVIKPYLLRKGMRAIKVRSADIRVDIQHSTRLSSYCVKRERGMLGKVFAGWAGHIQRVKKVERLLLKLSSLAQISTIRAGFREISNYYYTNCQSVHVRNIRELQKQICKEELSQTAMEKQYLTVETKAQSSMRTFFTLINSHLQKRTQKERVASLKGSLGKWMSTVSKYHQRENKLSLVLTKTCSNAIRSSFLRILLASIGDLQKQYRQKISAIRKRDKINQQKIEKGEAAFGEQLRRERERNQGIMKDLMGKQRKFNRYLKSHQEYYSGLHRERLLKMCWGGWKRVFGIRKSLGMVIGVWEKNKKRVAFGRIKQEDREVLGQISRVTKMVRQMELCLLDQVRYSYESWRGSARMTELTDLRTESSQILSRITATQSRNDQMAESHANFISSFNTKQTTKSIFKAWKAQAISQKLIQIKSQSLIRTRKQHLFKQIIHHLDTPLLLIEKSKSLTSHLSKTKRTKQKRVLTHFNSNIYTLKHALKLISNKLSHSSSHNLSSSFAKILRVTTYKHLALTYQLKKTSTKFLSSLITQSNLNKQKIFYSFLSHDKIYHYLPNILSSIQRRSLQSSFYKLREVGYENRGLILRQADSIMESQKYLVNVEMRQMGLENIDGKELKEYLDERIRGDGDMMRRVVCRLRLQGNKKRLIRCWNSWVEKIKLRRMAQESLGRVIELSDCFSKYWSRWKKTNMNSSTSLRAFSRNELIQKHNQLGKLSDLYRKQLFEMRGQITQLRFLNNSQQPKLATTTRIALSRLSQSLNKGLSTLLKRWLDKRTKRVTKQKKYDELTRHIQQLLSRRSSLMQKISEVNSGNQSLRENCKEGGVQVERLKDLLCEKENLSISLADKKHNIKILLQDNLKIKQRLKLAQDQAVKLVHEFKPLLDRTNLY